MERLKMSYKNKLMKTAQWAHQIEERLPITPDMIVSEEIERTGHESQHLKGRGNVPLPQTPTKKNTPHMPEKPLLDPTGFNDVAKNANTKGKLPSNLAFKPADTIAKNANNDILDIQDSSLKTFDQKLDHLFREALKDIKLQVEPPKGYSLFKEPKQDPDDPEIQQYTLTEKEGNQ
jgi:hypothetical protein